MPEDYKIEEIDLGYPKRDSGKGLAIMGLIHIFDYMDLDEMEIQAMQEKNQALKHFVAKIEGPINPVKLQASLKVALKKRDKVTKTTHLD